MNKFIKIFTATVGLAVTSTALILSCIKAKKPNKNKNIDLSNMELVFEDNFDGELDKNTWDTSCETPKRRGGYWAPEQCFTKDGKLIIRTEYKENGAYGSGWYTGTCRSRNLKDFKYGYFEVSCKIPAAQGLWSAFWMMNDSMTGESKKYENGSEIDIMESPYYNDPKMHAKLYRNTTMHTIHINGYGDEHRSKVSKQYEVQQNMYKTFNTYGVLWTEDEYVFYINGKETWRTNFGVSQVPEYLWLSVEIAGENDSANPYNKNNKFCFSGEIEKNDKNIFPADFEVDYVRVYQFK